MTNEQILKKAIEKAVKNGYDGKEDMFKSQELFLCGNIASNKWY